MEQTQTEPLTATLVDKGDKANVTELIRLEIERIDADPDACTRKFSQTLQVRRAVAAMRVLGVERGSFRCRTTHRKSGEYGPAHLQPLTRAAEHVVREYAECLAANGLDVHLYGSDGAFAFTARHGEGRVIDHNHKENTHE